MTSDQKVLLVKKIVLVFLSVALVLGAWFFPKGLGKSLERMMKKAGEKATFEKAPMKAKEGGEAATANVQMRAPKDVTPEKLETLLKQVVSPEGGVAIIHCHLEGDPASERLADIFNVIQKKYGKLVSVTRVGFQVQPADWQAQRGIKLPYVMMIAGKKNVFQFQGLWSYAKVEQKVEEVIFGLERVNKDWRPVVPGMTPKSR